MSKSLPLITEVCCFFGRHYKVERVIRFFLDQIYRGEHHLLLYNNACSNQILDDIPELADKSNKTITLINNCKDLVTGLEYTNVGDIFRDAISFVDKRCKILNWMDSDDIFLPTHTSEGAFGMIKAHHLFKKAYKPHFSYFYHGDGEIELAHNNMEPSIFVDYQYVIQKGFDKTSASYHNGWLTPLKNEDKLLSDLNGKPTLIYDWNKEHGTYKISGSGDDGEENLKNHRAFETNFGDGTLTPISREEAQKYYDLVKTNI